MKFISSVLVGLLVASSSYAVSLKGKCAKEAVDAAVMKWADVPNPDPNLEYIPYSAVPISPRSNVYIVVLAFSDGNDVVPGKYKVTFHNYASCSGAEVNPQ